MAKALAKLGQVTGILLRSDVVAGWPDLLVDGFGNGETPLKRLRMERLSKNVLICLYKVDARNDDCYSTGAHAQPIAALKCHRRLLQTLTRWADTPP